MTQDELESFVDAIIEPLYQSEVKVNSSCSSDACPIDFSDHDSK